MSLFESRCNGESMDVEVGEDGLLDVSVTNDSGERNTFPITPNEAAQLCSVLMSYSIGQLLGGS